MEEGVKSGRNNEALRDREHRSEAEVGSEPALLFSLTFSSPQFFSTFGHLCSLSYVVLLFYSICLCFVCFILVIALTFYCKVGLGTSLVLDLILTEA